MRPLPEASIESRRSVVGEIMGFRLLSRKARFKAVLKALSTYAGSDMGLGLTCL